MVFGGKSLKSGGSVGLGGAGAGSFAGFASGLTAAAAVGFAAAVAAGFVVGFVVAVGDGTALGFKPDVAVAATGSAVVAVAVVAVTGATGVTGAAVAVAAAVVAAGVVVAAVAGAAAAAVVVGALAVAVVALDVLVRIEGCDFGSGAAAYIGSLSRGFESRGCMSGAPVPMIEEHPLNHAHSSADEPMPMLTRRVRMLNV